MTDQTTALEDLRQTAAVAADYTTLQGLINVTTGLGFVLWALDHASWAAVVMGLGAGAGSLYYRLRFGQAVRRGSVAATLAVVLTAFAVCMAGLVVDRLLAGPVLALPLLAAACFVVAYRLGYRHVGVTRTHWVAVALLVVGSLAPLLGLAFLGASTGMLLLGVALVLVGLADHVRLVAAMKPVPRD